MTTPVDQALLVKEITQYNTAKEALYNKLKSDQLSANLPEAQLTVEQPPSGSSLTKADLAKYSEYQTKFKAMFNENYNTITTIRMRYFTEIDSLNRRIRDQEAELAELNAEHTKLKTGASTEYRNLKNQKYGLAKEEYYHHLYTVCGLAQVFVLLLLVLVILGYVPQATGLAVFSVVVVVLAAYVVYYVFFRKMNRDMMVFNRFRYSVDKDYKTAMSGCPENRQKEREKEAELEAKVRGMLTSTAGTCPLYITSSTDATTTVDTLL